MQFLIATGVVTAMTGVFWGLDSVFTLNAVAAHVASLEIMTGSMSLRISALLMTSGVLGAVLGSVQVARLVVRLRRPRRAAG
jgi:small ligand-binding sensory domain FIST